MGGRITYVKHHFTALWQMSALIRISVIEGLSIYCHWIEEGVPVEHFLDIVPLKKQMLYQSYIYVYFV